MSIRHGILKSICDQYYLKNISVNEFIENRYYGKENVGSNLIYIAAMPKSAGTYISKTIAHNFNLKYRHVGNVNGNCEFDIYLPNFFDNFIFSKNVIVHQHTLATKGNLEYLNYFKIKPVVVVRDLHESIYSFHRHILKYKNTWPIFEYPKSFFVLSKEDQLDYIVDFISPWLIYFKESWRNAMSGGNIDALYITYGDFVKDKEGVMGEILKWNGLEMCCVEWLGKGSARYEEDSSVVVEMSDKQNEQLERMQGYYKL